MRKYNLIYAQLNEAIEMSLRDIFEYRRIGLVLFDNIVEFLLNNKVRLFITNEKHKNIILNREYFKINKELHYYENITKYSVKYDLINLNDKYLLDFCHNSRNNVYHHFNEDERITDFCILVLSDFLYNNIERLIDFNGLAEFLNKNDKNYSYLLQQSNVNSYDNIRIKLNSIKNTFITPSSEILQNILIDKLTELKEFWEGTAFESWDKFNELIFTHDMKELVNEHLQKIKGSFKINLLEKMSSKIFHDIEHCTGKISDKSTIDAFNEYQKFNKLILPYYLSLKFYISIQEAEYFNQE